MALQRGAKPMLLPRWMRWGPEHPRQEGTWDDLGTDRAGTGNKLGSVTYVIQVARYWMYQRGKRWYRRRLRPGYDHKKLPPAGYLVHEPDDDGEYRLIKVVEDAVVPRWAKRARRVRYVIRWPQTEPRHPVVLAEPPEQRSLQYPTADGSGMWIPIEDIDKVIRTEEGEILPSPCQGTYKKWVDDEETGRRKLETVYTRNCAWAHVCASDTDGTKQRTSCPWSDHPRFTPYVVHQPDPLMGEGRAATERTWEDETTRGPESKPMAMDWGNTEVDDRVWPRDDDPNIEARDLMELQIPYAADFDELLAVAEQELEEAAANDEPLEPTGLAARIRKLTDVTVRYNTPSQPVQERPAEYCPGFVKSIWITTKFPPGGWLVKQGPNEGTYFLPELKATIIRKLGVLVESDTLSINELGRLLHNINTAPLDNSSIEYKRQQLRALVLKKRTTGWKSDAEERIAQRKAEHYLEVIERALLGDKLYIPTGTGETDPETGEEKTVLKPYHPDELTSQEMRRLRDRVMRHVVHTVGEGKERIEFKVEEVTRPHRLRYYEILLDNLIDIKKGLGS